MYEGVVQNLIDELGRLPGVGPKSAQRIAFHLVGTDPADVRRLAAALVEVTERIRFCRVCGNVAEEEECRLSDGSVTELILATDPNLEGEATATYLARLVKPLGLRVTRPASGLPVGGDLEYADEVTLGRAFEGRRLLDV